MSERFLIVGLGNPGARYTHTRHNIGWQVLDELAARHGWAFRRSERRAAIASGQIGGRTVLLAKPNQFMNRSGGPTQALLRYYTIEPARLLVVCDHLDLPLGILRLRAGGGAGGQKGLRDIQERLGSQAIAQLRLGIGRPPGKMEAATYVLRRFPEGERILHQIVCERAASALECWLTEGIDVAMTRYNGSVEETPRLSHLAAGPTAECDAP